ncbi:MAG: hypothetical protein JSS62_05360 [Verrucomicrobia bacterium]|nr:hypothetical protein [Verrucomicrobiota bacterium]MBS0647273.1 hypothetical protein [Verrucomicrobiota bacterium]
MDSLSSSQGVLVSAHHMGAAADNPESAHQRGAVADNLETCVLPQEILLIIFSYLRAVSHQMAFLSTCKGFQVTVLDSVAGRKFVADAYLYDVEDIIRKMPIGYARSTAYHELAKVQVSRNELELARKSLECALVGINHYAAQVAPYGLAMAFLEWAATSRKAQNTVEQTQFFVESAVTTISTIPYIEQVVEVYLQLARDDGRDTLFSRHMLNQAFIMARSIPRGTTRAEFLTLCVQTCISSGIQELAEQITQSMEQLPDREAFYCLTNLARAYALNGERDKSHQKFLEFFEKILAMEGPVLKIKNLMAFGLLCRQNTEVSLADESFRLASELILGIADVQQREDLKINLFLNQCVSLDYSGAKRTFETIVPGANKDGAAYMLAQVYAKEGDWSEVEPYFSAMSEREQSSVLLNFAGYHVERELDASDSLRRAALLPHISKDDLQRYIRMRLLNADVLQQSEETRVQACFSRYLAMASLGCYGPLPCNRIAGQLTIVKLLSAKRSGGAAAL